VEMLNKQNKTLEGYVETIFEVCVRLFSFLRSHIVLFCQLYDTDGDGTISRQEIVDFCKRQVCRNVWMKSLFLLIGLFFLQNCSGTRSSSRQGGGGTVYALS